MPTLEELEKEYQALFPGQIVIKEEKPEEKIEEEEEGFLKKTARALLPKSLEERFFGEEEITEEKSEIDSLTKEYDKLFPGKEVKEEEEKRKLFVVEKQPGIFQTVDYSDIDIEELIYNTYQEAATKELTEIEDIIELRVRELEELPKPEGWREKYLEAHFLTALPGGKKKFAIEKKE